MALLQIVTIWIILYIYTRLACFLLEGYHLPDIFNDWGVFFSSSLGLVCRVNWKFGLFYCIAYSLIKVWWIFDKRYVYIANFVLHTIICYCFIFFWAGPYLLSSFFQSFTTNTLLHFIIMGGFLEGFYRKYFPRLPTVKKVNDE